VTLVPDETVAGFEVAVVDAGDVGVAVLVAEVDGAVPASVIGVPVRRACTRDSRLLLDPAIVP
jgi:hypothetical protein